MLCDDLIRGLDRDLTLSASTNSIMACRFISVASKAIGLPLYTAGLVVGLNAATSLRHGRGQCPTPGRAVPDGCTAAGSARSLDELFGPATALRICLKSTEDRVLKRRRLFASGSASFQSSA
jgi:hypothetical protein